MSESLVKWREWSVDAFKEAADTDRLVLLSISAVWCHWCHVMDSTSYSDPDIAAYINENFVPVRVDNDKMPDVNERYNQGGWPTTAVLAATGEVLVGATYVPPDKLMDSLTSMVEFYRDNRDELKGKLDELRGNKAEQLKSIIAAEPDEASNEVVDNVVASMDAAYDHEFGGFGKAPKFPIPETLDLLLVKHRYSGGGPYLGMAEKTMRGMAGYGMYDQVMGGFFRYSVNEDWSIPHFEKMTESNAGLMMSYADAYRLTGNIWYLDVVEMTASYFTEWLLADEGYFGGSQDADEEYYLLSSGERKERKHPFIDLTLYVNLNAKMALAFMSAYELTGDRTYLDTALGALRYASAVMKGEGGGLYHYFESGPKRFGMLPDQSAMLVAYLHAFQITGDPETLSEALSVLGFMEETLWDDEHGGFYDLQVGHESIGALAYRTKPFAENAEMSVALNILYKISEDERYRDMAGKCLYPYSKSYTDYGYMAAVYALAVDFHLNPTTEVALVGDIGSDGFKALQNAAFGTYVPRRIIRIYDYVRDAGIIEDRCYHPSGPAAAYVCKGTVCGPNIERPDELKAALGG
jgi:hypothetical protein